MNFFIIDKITNEMVGLFKSREEAELYYLKINVVERLKLYRHNLLNNVDECIDSIFKLRNIEKLMQEIIEFDPDESQYVQGALDKYITMCRTYFNETKYEINYKVEYICDGDIKSFYTK